MKKPSILFIFGTRPEAIKMAPIIRECERRQSEVEIKICITGQHKEMLKQVLDFFNIKPDYDLGLMKPNQSLSELTSNAISAITKTIIDCNPDYILVQGDTTTAMAGALAGYYQKIKIGHVEAGLRSGNKYAPFPEEINRKIIGTIADYHFAPTTLASANLNSENVAENVEVTGNTVIDALIWGVEKVRAATEIAGEFNFIPSEARVILVTAHRRESFGEPFREICKALLSIAKSYPDICIVYPVHLNPNVQDVVRDLLSEQPNIYLIDPVGYPQLLWLMDRSYLVLTDSGGIQEEAPALGKPVLVLREVTERQEGIEAGTAILVGTDKARIIAEVTKLLEDSGHYGHMARAVNPYGDGTASAKILDRLLNTRI